MPATTSTLRADLEKLANPDTGHYWKHLWSLAKHLHDRYLVVIARTSPETVIADVEDAFTELHRMVQQEQAGIVADIRHLALMESNAVPIPEVALDLMDAQASRGWASLFSARNLKHLLPTPPAVVLPLSYFELRVFSHAARRVGLGRPVGSPYVAALDENHRRDQIVNSCRLVFLGAAIKYFCVAAKNYVYNNYLVDNGLYQSRRALEAEHTKRVKREVLLLQQQWDADVQKVQTRFTAQQASLSFERTLAARSASGDETARRARLLATLEADEHSHDHSILEPTAELDALTLCLAEYTNSMRAALQAIKETPSSLVVPSFEELGTEPREASQSFWSDNVLAYSGKRGLVLDFENGPLPREAWESQTLAYTDGVCEWLEQLIRRAKSRIDEVSWMQSSIASKRAMGRNVVTDENSIGEMLARQQQSINSVEAWDTSWYASRSDTLEARRRLGMIRNNQRRISTLSDLAHKLRLYSIRWLDWQFAEYQLSIATGYQQIEWVMQQDDRYLQVELYEKVHNDEDNLRHMLTGSHLQFDTDADVDRLISKLQTSDNRDLLALRTNVERCENAAAQSWQDIRTLVIGDDSVTLCGQVQEALLERFANKTVHQSEAGREQAGSIGDDRTAIMDTEESDPTQPAPTGSSEPIESVMDQPMAVDVMEALRNAEPLIPETAWAAYPEHAETEQQKDPATDSSMPIGADCSSAPQPAQEVETASPILIVPSGYERMTLSLPTPEVAERALRVRLHSLIRLKQGR